MVVTLRPDNDVYGLSFGLIFAADCGQRGEAAGAANKPAGSMINWRPLRGWHHAAQNHLRDTDRNPDDGSRFRSGGPPHVQGLPGYSNALRSDAEKKSDKDIDRAYQSTIKGRPDAEKKSDPWADVRPAPPAAAAKNKQ